LTTEDTLKAALKRAEEEYRGRTVLVTGADGFVGSHLTETLVKWGADVSVLVRRSLDNLVNIGQLREKIAIHQADVRSFAQVDTACQELQNTAQSIIFHLAAHTHVGDSWQHPEETLNTNVLGTLNLLWAIREATPRLHRFCYVGSSEEYGSLDEPRAQAYEHRDNGKVLLNETAPLNPKSVYATSKVAADFLSRNFFDAYDVPAVIARMFNNFGPRHSPRFITGTVITQALEREIVEIGWPHAQRDFTYIQDGVYGILMTALYGQSGQVYVFGQGEIISIGDWAGLILEVGKKHNFWGEKKLVTCEDRYRPGRTDEAAILADSVKLRELCGWRPQVDWEEGILRTIQWYAENRAFWEKQIDWR
jgi:dTDP-glucose 4,6-dehydratase